MPKRKRSEHPGVWIVQRGGKLYARWSDPANGRDTKTSLHALGFTSRTEALPWLIEKSRALRRVKLLRVYGESAGASRITLATALDEYRAARPSEDNWRHSLKPFRDVVAGVALASQITLRLLDRFRAGLAGAPSSRNRYMTAAGAFLRWARKRGYLSLTADQIDEALRPFKVTRTVPRILLPEEVRAIIEAARRVDAERVGVKHALPLPPALPWVLVAALTGMRPGELDALTWDCVDFGRGEIRVMGTKTGIERRVPLHDSPLLVKTLKALSQDAGALVVGKVAQKSWARLRAYAGLPANLPRNVLRKTCISAVASRSTYSEFLLRDRFGHSREVSESYYRRALSGKYDGPETVEGWLGVEG